LHIGERVIGTFNLGSSQPGAFNEDHLPLLGQVADQMVTAMERTRLFEETQRRARRERTIREITEKMRAATSLEQLVKTTAKELGNHLSAGHAIVELGFEKDTAGA
jgi:GAF domain-containing protein